MTRRHSPTAPCDRPSGPRRRRFARAAGRAAPWRAASATPQVGAPLRSLAGLDADAAANGPSRSNATTSVVAGGREMNVAWNVIVAVVPFLTGVALGLLVFLCAGLF